MPRRVCPPRGRPRRVNAGHGHPRTQTERRTRASATPGPARVSTTPPARRVNVDPTRTRTQPLTMNKFPPSLAELPPISSPTRVVTIERMEDFTRLSLIIPNDAVASVRVGTQVRINGSPLLVASVNQSQNDPNSVVASFGIAQSSPLANTLKQLYPDATVQFEVDGMPVGHADVMDQLARKNAR